MLNFPEPLLVRTTRLLSQYAGTPVNIVYSEPVTEGWSARVTTSPWPQVTRCIIQADTDRLPNSIILKVRRPATHQRSEPERFHQERAALEFLALLGNSAGPGLLTADDELLIMEDLGTGPALEDLLVEHDAAAALHGLVAFATALGQMHASTAGHAAEYYQLRSRYGLADPAFDRISIVGINIESRWKLLRQMVADLLGLPVPDDVEQDIDTMLLTLSEPRPYLAFSNGDTCPTNCRITATGLRFLDFEHAAFRHALLDVAALRFPFPGCPCWSRLPATASQKAEHAYRQEMARSCPDILDDARYERELTAACAAWTIVRMLSLPKRDRSDEPHPMGFSRRGQLLDTMHTTIQCSQQSGSLPALAAWLVSVTEALHARWPHLAPAQPFYPAFQP